MAKTRTQKNALHIEYKFVSLHKQVFQYSTQIQHTLKRSEQNLVSLAVAKFSQIVHVRT